MEVSNFDRENRPSCKSFHFITISKNFNLIINNDENKDDSNKSKNNNDNPVILPMNTQFIQDAIKLSHT